MHQTWSHEQQHIVLLIRWAILNVTDVIIFFGKLQTNTLSAETEPKNSTQPPAPKMAQTLTCNYKDDVTTIEPTIRNTRAVSNMKKTRHV